MSLNAADGSVNVTVVEGDTYTGILAPDGSLNVVESEGTSPVGSYHPCGAHWVTVASGEAPLPITAPDGSMYVTETPALNYGLRVTVVEGELGGGGVSEFTDDFNRANGSIIDDVTWAISGGGAEEPVIVSNQLAASGSNSAQAYAIGTFPDDQYAQLTFQATETNQGGGPMVRINPEGSGFTGYLLYVGNAGGPHIYELPTFTELAALNETVNPGDTIKLEVEGTTLTAYLNDVSIGSVSDATYTSGNPGIDIAGTSARFDDFVAGPFNP